MGRACPVKATSLTLQLGVGVKEPDLASLGLTAQARSLDRLCKFTLSL